MWWFLMCSGILSNSLFRCERLKMCVSGLSPWHSGPRCSPVQTQVHVFTTTENQGGSKHSRHEWLGKTTRGRGPADHQGQRWARGGGSHVAGPGPVRG